MDELLLPNSFDGSSDSDQPGASSTASIQAGHAMIELFQRYRNATTLRGLQSCVRDFGELPRANNEVVPAIRLALTSNYSVQFFGQGFPLALAARGIQTAVFESDYNAWQLDLINESSALYNFKPTHILILLTSIELAFGSLRTPERVANAVSNAAARVLELTQARVLITLPEPLSEEISDQSAAYAWRHETRELLSKSLVDPRITLIDLDPLVHQVGSAAWHSDRFYNTSKIPFHPDRVPLILSQLAAATTGTLIPQCKLVICDLDDTLWGGRVGDEGWEGIDLDPAGTGRHHLRLQFFLKGLLEQGVLLAIASKNDLRPVEEVFEHRPEMLLTKEDFVERQIHWDPKSTSVARILRSLNLTPTSVVFLDDNPVERAEVARRFPELIIPDLPINADSWVPILTATGLFDRRVVTAESQKRRVMYQEKAEREAQLAMSGDLNTFLSDLNMTMSVYEASEHRERVVELIQKTNQFNLTTKRYNWQEIESVSTGGLALCYRLTDRFGDNGIISVVLVKVESEGDFSVDLWLMSCRVMGREAENAIMEDILRRLNILGGKRLIGRYIPTNKNGPVSALYERLGFSKLASDTQELRYEYRIDGRYFAASTPHIRCTAGTEKSIHGSS